MLRHLSYKIRFGTYLRSEHGIKKFAEMAMGQLILKVTKKSAFYREMNENLLVEKANLRMRADELYEQPRLTAGEFFSVRRRLWANNLIVTAVIVASIFLIAISVSAFLTGDAAVSGFLRWTASVVLGLVLTGGGLIVAERLIEAVIPVRSPSREDLEVIGTSLRYLWGSLLAGIELAILGITEVRASELAAAHDSAVLYLGFIALAMMLPITAGSIRWDAMRYIDRFKTTRSHREIDGRLAQIDSILQQNEEYESNFYKMKSIEYWDLLNDFRTLKDLYNEKVGMVEQLGAHFSQSYDAFQREAFKRYEADLRDLSTSSMRHIDVRETRAGQKLGQSAMMATGSAAYGRPGEREGQSESSERPERGERPSERGERVPERGERTPERKAKARDREPATNGEPNERAGQAEMHESDVYLTPKPVR